MKVRASPNAEPIDLSRIVTDQAAFRAWYEQALPRVYRYLFSRCGHDRELAEELTEQTFVEAVRRRASFDGRSDPLRNATTAVMAVISCSQRGDGGRHWTRTSDLLHVKRPA